MRTRQKVKAIILKTENRALAKKPMLRKHNKLPRHTRSWGLALLIGVACGMALSSVSAQGGLPIKAPAASFTIEGKEYRIADFKERRLMLWFLSTWCSSCIQAVKALEARKSKLEAYGLQVVVLKNHGNGGYPGPEIHDFINQYAASLSKTPNWMIGNATAEMGNTYNPRRYPDIYFLIDETGMLVTVDGAPAVSLDVIMNFASGNAAQG